MQNSQREAAGFGAAPQYYKTWGFRRRAALEAAGAKALIDTPSELLGYLD